MLLIKTHLAPAASFLYEVLLLKVLLVLEATSAALLKLVECTLGHQQLKNHLQVADMIPAIVEGIITKEINIIRVEEDPDMNMDLGEVWPAMSKVVVMVQPNQGSQSGLSAVI